MNDHRRYDTALSVQIGIVAIPVSRESMKATISAAWLVATSLWAAAEADEPASSSAWNTKTAAAYLDERETWWMDSKTAARDHGTFCISCHTAAPYALARPALR